MLRRRDILRRESGSFLDRWFGECLRGCGGCGCLRGKAAEHPRLRCRWMRHVADDDLSRDGTDGRRRGGFAERCLSFTGWPRAGMRQPFQRSAAKAAAWRGGRRQGERWLRCARRVRGEIDGLHVRGGCPWQMGRRHRVVCRVRRRGRLHAVVSRLRIELLDARRAICFRWHVRLRGGCCGGGRASTLLGVGLSNCPIQCAHGGFRGWQSWDRKQVAPRN